MELWKERAEQLVNEMTIEEAASQLKYDAAPVKRFGIPGYNWWNEALHGVARAGTATVFPQAIGLAAMFDDDFLREIADTIATEARAKYNWQLKYGDVDIYKGITLWSPNLNIFRDPRWGRGHETYGEDPYLVSRLGVAFIKGLQGEGKYLKTAACAKHFAVHSGPEENRHSFNAVASVKDMEETYLPAFEAAVKEGNVESVMGAYNRTNGEPCCGSKTLLVDILRNRWQFKGHVVSDCWAIRDFHLHHMVTKTPDESAALALKNGCDLNCGNTYLHMLVALKNGLVTEDQIRLSASRLMETRMKLGMFDEECEYNQISYLENDSPEHNKISLEASRKSIVMLKNDGILPLDKKRITTIGIIGPTAGSIGALEGNYNGKASRYITNLDGIRQEAGEDIRILYSEGSHLFEDRVQGLAWKNDRISEARAVAANSDMVILCLGLDATIEGEEGDTGNSFAAGDKRDLLLPETQRTLMEAVVEEGKPVILAVNSGSAMDLSFAQEKCSAVLQCWYSGAQGGKALAEILFGKTNPSGKLPVTFYYNRNLPDFTDYAMKNRTYRYMKDEALYPFGYGLSYTSFEFSQLEIEKAGKNEITGSFRVRNTGEYAGDTVAELYLDKKPAEKKCNGCNNKESIMLDIDNQPAYSLCGFKRISLEPEEEKHVSFKITSEQFVTVLENGEKSILTGEYVLYCGECQPDSRSKELTGSTVLSISFQL